MSDQSLSNGKSQRVMQFLVWSSILYLLILGFILASSAFSDGKIYEHSWLQSWPVVGRFASLTANELGDFLAGGFAPLAFVWLAGAVFIQSQELAAQRQELKLTRDTLKAQTKEIEETTRYIGMQTEILANEQEQRNAAEAHNDFITHAAALDRFIKDKMHGRKFKISFSDREPIELAPQFSRYGGSRDLEVGRLDIFLIKFSESELDLEGAQLERDWQNDWYSVLTALNQLQSLGAKVDKLGDAQKLEHHRFVSYWLYLQDKIDLTAGRIADLLAESNTGSSSVEARTRQS